MIWSNLPDLLQVVGNTELGDTWRQLALEVIVTLAESAPAMVRKNSKFLTDLSKFIVNLSWIIVSYGALIDTLPYCRY